LRRIADRVRRRARLAAREARLVDRALRRGHHRVADRVLVRRRARALARHVGAARDAAAHFDLAVTGAGPLARAGALADTVGVVLRAVPVLVRTRPGALAAALRFARALAVRRRVDAPAAERLRGACLVALHRELTRLAALFDRPRIALRLRVAPRLAV